MTRGDRHRSFRVDDLDEAPTAGAGLPVVVVGGGPIGLAAAAHLLDRGLEPLVLEAGARVGASIAQWGHVRLFSPWCLALDPVAVRLLTAAGWVGPDPDALPTGDDLLDRYLGPLAALPVLAGRIRLGARVIGVARRGLDKVRTPGREQLPFLVRVRDAHDARVRDVQASAVIDASGTWGQPNPLGASGLPALGEADAAAGISYGLPDILGRDRSRFAGRRVVVVGAGHSAATSLLALAELEEHAPATQIVWAVRSAAPRPLVGKGSAETDELPARGRLATELGALVDAGSIELIAGLRITAVELAGNRIRLHGDQVVDDHPANAGSRRIDADQVIAATGFRPDHSIARELQLSLDTALESASRLGPIIDPNIHTCGSVPVHGIAELAHPEPGYVIVGMKSYGRAPTFLLGTGYQQVRSVVSALAGDLAGAATPNQDSPTAGICAINRALVAPAATYSPPTPATGGAPLAGTAADWSGVNCCPPPGAAGTNPAGVQHGNRTVPG